MAAQPACKASGYRPRAAYAATRDFLRAQFPGLDRAVPAMVAAPQSHGSLLNFHPHLHSLSSLGVFDREGRFHPAPDDLDFSPLEELFRDRTLAMMLRREVLSEERARMLRNWKHSDPLLPDEAYCVDPDPGWNS